MRRARIKADGGGYYHCMSRIIERRQILDEAEKARLYKLMRDLAAFGGLEVLTYCFMSNHFHIHVLLRCRVRYFSDGLALGSAAFLEGLFQRYRAQFGANRKTGARAMRYGDWSGLHTLRDLRLQPVSLS